MQALDLTTIADVSYGRGGTICLRRASGLFQGTAASLSLNTVKLGRGLSLWVVRSVVASSHGGRVLRPI